MAIINDPDFLDRFQVIVNPYEKIISIRGSGGPTTGGATQGSAGSGTAAGAFIDSTNNFANVVAGDILAVTSDPSDNGGVMGHYKVSAVVNSSGLTLDRAISQTGASGVSYRVYKDGSRDAAGPALADGVTMQALYSFLKEEWRTNSLSASGEDLIKYTFPMVSITSEQFEIGGVSNSNWEFADDSGDGALAGESPRNLIRTGGWASINNSGVVIENYPGIITLGTLESDSQVYYQLTSATTDPENFVLTGAVNQSIRTLETVGGASTDGNKNPVSGVNATIVFDTTANAIVAPNGTDLYALGFTSGELIQVRQSASNNGFFTIAASGGTLGVSGVRVTETVTAEAANPAVISPMTDNRNYLVLRVRTKGKTYADSEIADIGVTQINTIVNRFPLAEADDPAIVLTDGQIGGDDTDATNEIQEVETFNTAGDGVIGASLTNGAFTFTSATAGFLNGAASYAANSVLQPGDSIEIANSGFMEIKSIDSDSALTVFFEPTGITGGGASDFQGGGTNVTFTTKTATLDSGSFNGTFAYTNGAATATLTDATRVFNADGGLGQRIVTSGDVLQVVSTNGNSDALGYYKVQGNAAANSCTLSAIDIKNVSTIVGDTVTYRVLDNGMFLQYKKVTSNTPASYTYADANTITSTDFTAGNGYYVGGTITISGDTGGAANNGTFIITVVNEGSSIDVVATDGTSPGFSAGAGDGTFTGSFGHIRTVGDVSYSYNWRLYGNNGSLAQCFQFLQRELRRATDIDGASGTSRGDITDLLMTFASPNGTTLNLFIDDVDPAEKNNLTQQDSTGTNRNFPFLVTLRIALNNNITNANTNKVVVFFSDQDGTGGNGDEFGTSGATIVQDENGADMVATDQTSSPKDFVYNYSVENADQPITVVCITDDTGQYVATTSTLTQDNVVNVSLVAGLERNYSNP